MDYEIKNEKPPKHIWDKVHEVFEVNDSETIYTYGNVIYNPAELTLPEEIIEHERVHMGQQKSMGGPDAWWELYFVDKNFRYDQEVDAYGKQLAVFYTKNADRNARFRHNHMLASFLASPLYKTDIGTFKAQRDIRESCQEWLKLK